MDYPYDVSGYNNSYSKYSDISIDETDSEYETDLLEENTKNYNSNFNNSIGCYGFIMELVWWIKQKVKQMKL